MITLQDALTDLQNRGYKEDFGICSASTHNEKPISPEEYIIDFTLRIDHMADPDEQVIVYAISSLDGEKKGFVVNTFGPEADPATAELVANLREKNKAA